LREPGPLGTPDRIRLEGSARTSGVASLLTTLVYDMAAYVDAETGRAAADRSITKREGMAEHLQAARDDGTFHGRGYVEIVDDKDGKKSTTRASACRSRPSIRCRSWRGSARSTSGPASKAKAYGLDGGTLLRVDITSRGPMRTARCRRLARRWGSRRTRWSPTTARSPAWTATAPPFPEKRCTKCASGSAATVGGSRS
jgi:hypothetical protein